MHASSAVKQSVLYKRYCSNGKAVSNNDNSNIAKAAIALSTMDKVNCTPEEEIFGGIIYGSSNDGYGGLLPKVGNSNYTVDTFLDIVPKIISMQRTLGKPNAWFDPVKASCDLSVQMAVIWSGSDDDYPSCLGGTKAKRNELGPDSQVSYFILDPKSKEKWEEVPHGESIQPGDIALCRAEDNMTVKTDSIDFYHIIMYVASWDKNTNTWDNKLVQEKYPGSNANTYEGSYERHYARVTYVPDPWSWDVNIRVFRFIGTPDENSPFRNIN